MISLSSVLDSSNVTTAVVTVAATALLLYLRQRSVSSNDRPWPVVPGALPLLGHFHLIGSLGRMVDQLEEWADHYGREKGCFEITMPGGRRTLVICRQDRALEVYKRRPRLVYRVGELREAGNSIGAYGLFTAEGSDWKAERKVVHAALNSQAQLQNSYLPVLKDLALRLVQKWGKLVTQNGSSVVIFGDLARVMADAITRTALGEDYDFLNNPSSTLATDVDSVLTGAVRRALTPIWYWRIPVIGQYLDGLGWSIARMRNTIRASVDRQELDMTGDEDNSTRTFLQKLLAVMRSNRTTISRKRVEGNVMTLFLAATDTTSKALLQALHILANSPDLQGKLRKEVVNFDWQNATMDELYTRNPRLKSFLHEIHRVYSTPLIFLETAGKVDGFCGSTLPAGLQIFALNRYCNKQKWSPPEDVPNGPNNSPAVDFDPERYLVPAPEKTWTCPGPSVKGTAFMPFGYGVRSCPGQKYSELLSYCVLVALLQTFDEIKMAPNHPLVKLIWDTISIVPDKPIELLFIPTRN